MTHLLVALMAEHGQPRLGRGQGADGTCRRVREPSEEGEGRPGEMPLTAACLARCEAALGSGTHFAAVPYLRAVGSYVVSCTLHGDLSAHQPGDHDTTALLVVQ